MQPGMGMECASPQINHPMEETRIPQTLQSESASKSRHDDGRLLILNKQPVLTALANFHAGYFRISLSLCSQALLWRVLAGNLPEDAHFLRRLFAFFPSPTGTILWSLALLTQASLSVLYLLRCFFFFELVKAEFMHHVGVNYLFAPWISWLLLLQSWPLVDTPRTSRFYVGLWWVFIAPIAVLDVKIYGQWLTKGRRVLSMVANPTSQLSVIGNLAAARAAAVIGWRESALCMFSLGMVHYLVLFVTLYQRLSGGSSIPVMLRPVFFLFIAAPSMASLSWDSISGCFDTSCKMLFFLSLFLFLCLVCRPRLFKKSMRKFNVAWWAYSFPVTVLALASTEYAKEVKGVASLALMLALVAISVLVLFALLLRTAIKTCASCTRHNIFDHIT